ncbi:MAG: SPOR domain-containing protein [Chitinophagaceae bacterium]
MKKLIFSLLCFTGLQTFAQTDSAVAVAVVVHKDFRLDILARKEAELNLAVIKAAARSAMGYRLQVLSTNDRELAMKTRTQLLQRYPDQKVYMSFQAPYVKLTFGNFTTKQEAELYKKQISRMLEGASVYTLSQRIEIKPEKEIKDDSNK